MTAPVTTFAHLTPRERAWYWTGEWLAPAFDPTPDLSEGGVEAILAAVEDLEDAREVA